MKYLEKNLEYLVVICYIYASDRTGTLIRPGVRVFAPKYPTQKGSELGRLWYLPTSRPILIDWKLVICLKML